MSEHNVFRKTFHVPREWMKKSQFQYLVNHRYVAENAKDALDHVKSTLSELGYMEDNHRMIHDYLHFMIMDLLDKNKEVYITEEQVRTLPCLLSLMNGMTPDFVVRRGNGRPKTMVVDIYVGDRPSSEVKNKYKTLGFFADVCVVTPHDFPRQLKSLLNAKDIDYLYQHFQVFLVEYHYWRASIKLRKVLMNDVINVPIQQLPERDNATNVEIERYMQKLGDYAASMADQTDL